MTLPESIMYLTLKLLKLLGIGVNIEEKLNNGNTPYVWELALFTVCYVLVVGAPLCALGVLIAMLSGLAFVPAVSIACLLLCTSIVILTLCVIFVFTVEGDVYWMPKPKDDE